jgi:hypothetical protein
MLTPLDEDYSQYHTYDARYLDRVEFLAQEQA